MLILAYLNIAPYKFYNTRIFLECYSRVSMYVSTVTMETMTVGSNRARQTPCGHDADASPVEDPWGPQGASYLSVMKVDGQRMSLTTAKKVD